MTFSRIPRARLPRSRPALYLLAGSLLTALGFVTGIPGFQLTGLILLGTLAAKAPALLQPPTNPTLPDGRTPAPTADPPDTPDP